MRIIAGEFRGRALASVGKGDAGAHLRPTTDRVRESLFNVLNHQIDFEGLRVLDLFAGTGALGFEAMSRGAVAVDWVEQAAPAARMLEDNVKQLEAEGATVHEADAYFFLDRRNPGRAFDIVFLDPPFDEGRYDELCGLLDENGWLSDGARIYVEQDRRSPKCALPAGWEITREKTAGNVRYSLISSAQKGNDG